MLYHENVSVIRNESLTNDIYDMRFRSRDISAAAKPGQFINVYCNDSSRLLPRPISICEVNGEEIRIVYRVAGKGTKELSGIRPGEKINVTGPAGNGYDVDMIDKTYSSVMLFGGGVGIPPMVELSKRLKIKTDVFLGYRDCLFLNEDFSKDAVIHIATEDGSAGTRGNVLDALKASGVDADLICACGPLPMLRAIKKYAEESGKKAYFSMEERMACGVGACLGCVCKTVEKDGHSKVNNTRVCADGPVFDASAIII